MESEEEKQVAVHRKCDSGPHEIRGDMGVSMMDEKTGRSIVLRRCVHCGAAIEEVVTSEKPSRSNGVSAKTERLYLACRELVDSWPRWEFKYFLGNIAKALADVPRNEDHSGPPAEPERTPHPTEATATTIGLMAFLKTWTEEMKEVPQESLIEKDLLRFIEEAFAPPKTAPPPQPEKRYTTATLAEEEWLKMQKIAQQPIKPVIVPLVAQETKYQFRDPEHARWEKIEDPEEIIDREYWRRYGPPPVVRDARIRDYEASGIKVMLDRIMRGNRHSIRVGDYHIEVERVARRPT